MAAVGIGAMLGALGLAVAGRRVPKGRALLAGGGAFATLLVLFAAARSFTLAALLLALVGCDMIITTALANTILQPIVPYELRGRVMAFYAFVFIGMSPFCALFARLPPPHPSRPGPIP